VPNILALTPYRDVFVAIDSNRISKFVSIHDVVMAVLLGGCLFVCVLSLVAFDCNENPTGEIYSEVCIYFLEPPFPRATEVNN
jgi:hypothetical protein